MKISSIKLLKSIVSGQNEKNELMEIIKVKERQYRV
jgi:hypothetical protein